MSDFVSKWVAERDRELKRLHFVLAHEADEAELQTEVARALKHYENYFAAKAEAARKDTLALFCPTWTSPLENALMWIGGWRPSVLFQLAYSEMGQQVESELAELLEGTDSSSLAALSSKQLFGINDLQCKTLEEEDELSERMAALHQTMANGPMAELARGGGFERALEEEIRELQLLLAEADRLRFHTLKRMLDNLTPRQSLQMLDVLKAFLVAFTWRPER